MEKHRILNIMMWAKYNSSLPALVLILIDLIHYSGYKPISEKQLT